MNRRKSYYVILDDIGQKFNIDKFKKLDKELSKIIYDGRYEELLPFDAFKSELEAKFDELFTEKKKNNLPKGGTKNVIKEFAMLCEKNDKAFYLTRTFKTYIQMSMLNDYSENVELDLLKYINKYLEQVNKKYLMVNDRTACVIMNATRLRKYGYYRKVKNILKHFKEEYNLAQYEDVIKNKTTLNKNDFFDFISEVNKVKIDIGIIPLEVCEYLICEMLNPNSAISMGYVLWADLRECVFCDFLSHMQINKYKVFDYLNYSQKLEKVRGNYTYNKKTICIDEDNIYNFSNVNANAINTTMHEMVHFDQYFLINKNDFSGSNYEIFKEDILINNINNFKKKNYWYLCKEINARKKAIENTIEYLNLVGYNINNLKIWYQTSSKTELISLLEYKQRVFEDCEYCLLEKEYLETKLNFNKKINRIIKREPKLILDMPILKYEYNEDGTKKKIKDIIESLEETLENRELTKESVKGIFKYSLQNAFNIKKIENLIKKIVKHKYNNEKNRKMFLEALESTLIEKQSRTKLIKELDRRQEYESLLERGINYMNTVDVS